MELNDLGIYVMDDISKLERKTISNMIKEFRNSGKPCFVFFEHEWNKRSQQITSHIESYNKKDLKIFYGRCCEIKSVDMDIVRKFCDLYHIQGSNRLGMVGWGIYSDNELLGVISLGRHHRQNAESNAIILDRLCFRADVRVIGGASKLFAACKKWAMENNITKIISFSDNRYSLGNVYNKLGFTLETELDPDYFYISKVDNQYRSKQSQKKKNVNCPSEMTEKKWAELRGLIQVFDAGKKRWTFKIKLEKSMKSFLHRRQGYYQTKNSGIIYFSSSYELRAAYLLDKMPEVESYSTQVRFTINGQERFIDFLAKNKNGTYSIVEVKPERQISKCTSQLEDNKSFAKKNDWGFTLWTEKELGLSEFKIREWADKLITEITGIDVDCERKKRSCERSKKYYETKVSQDKTSLYCEYCKETHTPLMLTYKKNIERNGRYICEKEGGSISGKKPKNKKENPYALEGKKQCTECDDIKLFNEFGFDKSRADGYSNKCKICRSEQAKKKYETAKKPIA